MKKIGLLASICMFTLLVGGCAINNENAATENNDEVISDEPEVSAEEEKHFWVNRQGEVFDSTNAPVEWASLWIRLSGWLSGEELSFRKICLRKKMLIFWKAIRC